MVSTTSSSPALRLLHYWWPMLMGVSLALVVQRATGRPMQPAGLMLLLSGIAAVYSLDRVADAMATRDSAWLAPLLLAAGVAASIACAVLMPHLPPHTAWLVPLLGIVSMSYPLLKRAPLSKAIVVPVVWTWSAIALPFDQGSWAGWQWTQVPVALPLLLLLAAGCLLCDLKDADTDRDARVASVPVMIGVSGTARLALTLAVVGGVSALLQHRPGLVVCAVCLSMAASRPRLISTAVVGPLIVDAILTLPGLLIAARVI